MEPGTFFNAVQEPVSRIQVIMRDCSQRCYSSRRRLPVSG
jgi:hypothetical protein